MSRNENDNLELLSIKCPHCSESSPAKLWVTMSLTTTSCSASFSFGSKPKDSNSLMCPKCKGECNYLDILNGMVGGSVNEN